MLKSTQLKNLLVAELTAGRFKPGSALPTEMNLAKQFEISRPTVRRALAEMEQEGLVRREQGRGTFVSETAQQNLSRATGSFALVISGANDTPGLAIIRGFEKQCRKVHHGMLLLDSENDFNQQAEIILRMSQMDLAGAAIVPVTAPVTPSYHALALMEKEIPLVFCHRIADGTRAPLISVPHEEQGRLVGKAFAENGHRRVAMMIGYKADGLKAAWAKGIRHSLKSVDGQLPDEFIYCNQSTSLDYKKQEKELVETLKKMLESENPPTAIFAVIDDFAQAVYFALESLGKRVPEDISLVGLGDINRGGPFTHRLTSVVIDNEDMGCQAVNLLHEIEDGNRDLNDPATFAVEISISDGQTLGPVTEK